LYFPEPEFVNVKGAQESIPPSWELIPGLLKRFENSGSGYYYVQAAGNDDN
jgi:hypothetical protein